MPRSHRRGAATPRGNYRRGRHPSKLWTRSTGFPWREEDASYVNSSEILFSEVPLTYAQQCQIERLLHEASAQRLRTLKRTKIQNARRRAFIRDIICENKNIVKAVKNMILQSQCKEKKFSNNRSNKKNKERRAAERLLQKSRDQMRQHQRDRKHSKTHQLDPHGIIGDIGGVLHATSKAPGCIDQAIKMSQAFDEIKRSIKYDGTDTDDMKNNLICRLEDIIALLIALSNTKNYAGFMATLHLYFRSWYTGSVLKLGLKMIQDLLGPAQLEPHSDDKSKSESWIEEPETKVKRIRDAIGCWKSARKGDFGKHVASLINILVTFGCLGEKHLKLGNFTLFQTRAWDVQKDALHFSDVVLDTFGFFIERGYAAFVEGDISLLLYDEKNVHAYEEEYAQLVSCNLLLDAGRLEDLKNESIKNESDYSVRLDKCIAKTLEMMKSQKNEFVRNTLNNKLVTLKKMQSKLIVLQKKSPIRVKPFGMSIFGGSSVGKTTLNTILTRVILSANGYPSGKDAIVTLNDSDAYQSEYRSHHVAVTMDDYGNTVADKYETCPTAKIIDFLNNVPKAALSPLAESKGNIMIRPKLVSVTTNVKKLLANLFSNEPISILRRFEVHLTATLRPEWVDPVTGGLNKAKCKGLFIPDAWLLKLQGIQIISNGDNKPDTYKWYTIAEEASIHDAIEIIIGMSKIHYAQQEDYVSHVEKFYEVDFCEHFHVEAECPKCAAARKAAATSELREEDPSTWADLKPHAAESDISETYGEPEIRPFEDEDDLDIEQAVDAWYRECGLTRTLDYVQSKTSNLMSAFDMHKDDILHNKVFQTCVGLGALYTGIKTYQALRRAMSATEDKQPEMVSIVCRDGETRDFPGEYYIEDGVKCVRFFEDMSPHGLDQNMTLKQARAIGKPVVGDQDHENNWKKVEIAPLPRAPTADTRSSTQFDKIIEKQLAYCTVFDFNRNKQRSCNIWPVKGNVWLLPNHMINQDSTVTIQVRTGRHDSVGKTFSEVVDETKISRFNDDYLLVRLLKGGPVRDTVDMLLQEDYKFSKDPLKMIVKTDEGIIRRCVSRVEERREFPTKIGKLDGFSYMLNIDTAEGMCIAPVYSYRGPHVILGFHLAGKTGTPYGVAGYLTAKDVNAALEKLERKNTLGCHSQGVFPTRKYGIDYTPAGSVPQDHAVNQLEADASGQDPCVEIYGEHSRGRSFFKSNVRKSCISDAVRDVMEISRDHGPPSRLDIGKHWKRDIDLMSHPKGDFTPSIFLKARQDLSEKIRLTLEQKSQAVALTYPLSHDYILSGADGIAAFSRIPLKTSTGWPLNKKKSLYMEVVDRNVDGISEVVDFTDDQFMQEIDRARDILKTGQRIHTVFRGNLKDEPTKWTKDKIRVFAGCELAFTYLVRQYFLPIIRLIQNNWIDFECAVGINAHGKQWQELTEAVTKFGKDRIIAGDYSAFDKTAGPEAMMSSFVILIDMAEICGYSKEDLVIMRGLATEISYPIYELDGVIAQFFGSNPSGHPLTVIVNNLMNSLYMRYVYYSLHDGEEDIPRFDEVISLLCYGDDNIMSVSEHEKLFKMCNIVPVLDAVGIKYTKADKTAVSEDDDFEHLHDVEFLKRAFVYNEPFGAHTAALAIASIGKSLHNNMVSKDTPREEIAAQAIRSANTEFAYHGPEEFALRQPQLYEVAERTGLTQLVGILPTLNQIVDRYEHGRVPRSIDEEPLIFH